MRIFRFSVPGDERFARASRIGTWAGDDSDECPECGNPRQDRIQPLIVEWEAGSAHVGDFVWPGFDDEVVFSERVLGALDGVTGFIPGPIKMHQDPKLRVGGGEPRVWLPFEGSPVYDLWVTKWISMDSQRTTAKLVEKCEACGLEYYKLEGIERWEIGFDKETMESVTRHTPRTPGAGVFISQAELEGAGIFRIRQFPSWVFLTEEVKHLIEQRELTNVRFLEVGDLV